jgi:hypothetical protein
VQARTPAIAAGGAGQGVALGAVTQARYAGLGQVVADDMVHRGLLGMVWWVLVPRIRLIDTSLPVSGFACQWQPRRTRAPLCQ